MQKCTQLFVSYDRCVFLYTQIFLCLFVNYYVLSFYLFYLPTQLRNGGSVLQPVLTLIISLVVLLYSIKTFKRNLDWGDSLSLAESAVPVNPSNAKVFMTIGNHYAQKVRTGIHNVCASMYTVEARIFNLSIDTQEQEHAQMLMYICM